MTDLPTREEAQAMFRGFGTKGRPHYGTAPSIIERAYADGVLMTVEEWRATVDYDEASRVLAMITGLHFRAEPIVDAAVKGDT